MEIMDQMVLLGAPVGNMHILLVCYHMSFIVLFVGTIVYGIIYSTKTEPDTYRSGV
jgi:hypothetical protein